MPSKPENSLHPIFKKHTNTNCVFCCCKYLSRLSIPPKSCTLTKKNSFPPLASLNFHRPTCGVQLFLYSCRPLFRRSRRSRLGANRKCWTSFLRRGSSSRNCACFSDSELRGDGTTCGPQKRPPSTQKTREGVGFQVASAWRDRDGVLW